jgi:lipopolysaccharide/colanic/teichoic acid biosynthesis glycosyltransferase
MIQLAVVNSRGQVATQRYPLTVQPGITDYASIRYRDEESILASYADPMEGYVNDILPAKLALNKQYVRDRSLWVDVGIIFRTLYAIVQR